MTVDRDTRAEAIAAARRGIPHTEIARVAGVQARTIGRWVAEVAKEPASTPQPARAPEPELPSSALPGGTLDTMRQMLADTIAQSKAAKADGNHTAAQRAMANATALANTIARLEKNMADNADELRISRAEIDEARATVRARLTALAERPILCADCGKELSLSYGDSPKGKNK